MKQKPWLKYLIAVLLIGSAGLITPAIFNQISAVDSTQSSVLLAQRRSKYDQYMRQGYAATRRRQYSRALSFFRQALAARPGDRFARRAIANVSRYQRRVSRYRRVARRGRPRRRRGAATRGGQSIKLIPLMPNDKPDSNQQASANSSGSSLFLTTAKHPTFFFYIPQLSQDEELVFELEDENSGDTVYEITFKAPQKPGIISISLPTNKAPLELNKEYLWSLSKASNRPSDPRPEGLIKRENPSQKLANDLKKANPLDRIALYAENGYWEDSLRNLADLRRKSPQNEEINIEWGNLLGTVNLEEDIINAPLLSKR